MTTTAVPLPENAQIRTYSFSNATYLGDTRHAGTDSPAIITPEPQWAYAIQVPPHPLTRDPVHVPAVKLRISVHRGAIGVGILKEDRTRFHQEIFLVQQDGWQEIELTVPAIKEVGPLIVRNASPHGRSFAQCLLVEIASSPQASVPTDSTTPSQLPQKLDPEQTTVIFLHIPKTGGTTVWNLLSSTAKPAFNVARPDSLRQFLNFSHDEVRAYGLIYGHMPYGLHSLLPQKCKYAVFLRDPVDRVISAYYYIKRVPEHGLYQKIQEGMTLSEYALTVEVDNKHTRYLGGYDILEMLDDSSSWWNLTGNIGLEHLERAKKNLQGCDFIGFCEDLDRDMSELFLTLGRTPPIMVPRINQTSDRPKLHDVDKRTIDEIRQRNILDVQLYEYARQLRSR